MDEHGWQLGCLCSDTYFVMVLDTLAPRSALRATQGEGASSTDDLLHLLQQRACDADTGWQLPCPTCLRLVHGMDGERAARDADLEAVLTVRRCILRAAHRTSHRRRMLTTSSRVRKPCRLVCFAPREMPPLYMRDAGGAWALASGAGPPILDVEHGCPLRLRRESLRPYGVLSDSYPVASCVPRDAAAKLTAALHAHLSRLPHADAAWRFTQWAQLRPLYEHWDATERTMEAGA